MYYVLINVIAIMIILYFVVNFAFVIKLSSSDQ